MNTVAKVDMTRNPFRGIYADIAREKGWSRQHVRMMVKRSNPEILLLVAEKVRERREVMRVYEDAVG